MKLYIRRYRSFMLAFCCIYVPMCLLYKLYMTVLAKRNLDRICKTDSKFRDSLMSVLNRTTSILSNEHIESFLCYDSLWSALRFEGLAPWDNKVTLCALDASLRKIDELYLRRLFNNQYLKLDYQAYDGYYMVAKEDKILLEIYVFDSTMTKKEYKRVGIRRRVFPEGSDILDQFPASLVDGTLPTSKFENANVNVPREGIELQKYLYKDSWWIVKKPKGC